MYVDPTFIQKPGTATKASCLLLCLCLAVILPGMSACSRVTLKPTDERTAVSLTTDTSETATPSSQTSDCSSGSETWEPAASLSQTTQEPAASPEPTAAATTSKAAEHSRTTTTGQATLASEGSTDQTGTDELTLATDQPDVTELADQINSFIAENVSQGELSLAYVDLDSEQSYMLNATESYKAASTIKVPMSMYCYDQAFKGELDLNMTLTYDQAEDYEATGGLMSGAADGQTATLQTLLHSAILYSDNIATNMIFRYWRQTSESLSYRMDQAFDMHYSEDSEMNVEEACRLLERLYENPDDNPYYDVLLTDMKNSDWNRYLTAELSVSVAHKYGLFDGNQHDVTLVYTPHPYILIVYSRNLSGAEQILPQLGLLVYNWQTETRG